MDTDREFDIALIEIQQENDALIEQWKKARRRKRDLEVPERPAPEPELGGLPRLE